MEICEEFSEDVTNCSKDADSDFDNVVGQIEDILIGETFEKLQKDFMNKYYHQFEDTEENKLEYTMIFQAYQDEVECYIEKELQCRISDFTMETFLNQLRLKKDELEGEVFEVLLTFSDFLEFKNLMLDYKKDKEGFGAQFSEGLVVTSLSAFNLSRETKADIS